MNIIIYTSISTSISTLIQILLSIVDEAAIGITPMKLNPVDLSLYAVTDSSLNEKLGHSMEDVRNMPLSSLFYSPYTYPLFLCYLR